MRRLWSLAVGVLCAACGLTVLGTAGSDREPDGRTDADADAGAADADSEAAATDSDGATTDAVSTDAAPPLRFRLNINGPAHVGVDFPGEWTASPVPGICGPFAYAASNPLSNTNDAPLFAGEAFGDPLVCTVGSGLPAGQYRVVLYFAEIYFGPGCPGGGGVGSRVFDVLLEGAPVLANFDVFAAAGGCIASTTSDGGTPVVRSFDVIINDGTLDIEMPASTNNAKLSALELFGPL